VWAARGCGQLARGVQRGACLRPKTMRKHNAQIGQQEFEGKVFSNMKSMQFTTRFIQSLAVAGLLLAGCSAEVGDHETASGAEVGDEAELGELSEHLMSCSNPDGANSVMAAMAVAAAQELGRWQPKLDLVIGRSNGVSETTPGSVETVRITPVGKARCADGKCVKLQALLDLQYDGASNKVKLPGNVTVNAIAVRTRVVAKLREQLTCEAQPSNGRAANCPAEEHQLTFVSAAPGACDTLFTFKATSPTGGPLRYPAQLKNKLLWVDRHNPYVQFKSTGDTVSIDPTYGLNESNATTAGTCSAACVRITTSDLSGSCCNCLGATRTLKRTPWNANTYLCL
jgi:hypothetical protein